MGTTQDKMKAELELRRYAKSTQDAYLRYAKNFVAYLMRPAEELGEKEIRQFLLYLVRDKKVGEACHKLHVAAIKFLYAEALHRPEEVVRIPWPKVSQKLPDILCGSEVLALLEAIESPKHRAVNICPNCETGRMVRRRRIAPLRPSQQPPPQYDDSS